MIVDKQKNIHIYEKIIPQIKEFIPVLEQAKDMEVGVLYISMGKGNDSGREDKASGRRRI